MMKICEKWMLFFLVVAVGWLIWQAARNQTAVIYIANSPPFKQLREGSMEFQPNKIITERLTVATSGTLV